MFILYKYFDFKKLNNPVGDAEMDMLPINPHNNLIKPTIATANDGGSKSQSGYIQRQVKTKKTEELKVSDEGKRLIGEDPVIDEKSFLETIKEFITFLINKIKEIFNKIKNFKLPEKRQKPQQNKPGNFLAFTQHTAK